MLDSIPNSIDFENCKTFFKKIEDLYLAQDQEYTIKIKEKDLKTLNTFFDGIIKKYGCKDISFKFDVSFTETIT